MRFLKNLVGVILVGVSGCSNNTDSLEDGPAVGLLLPFTGSSSGVANNLERSIIFAHDRINAGGGIHGKNLRIVARDTHSDVNRCLSSAQELADEGVVAVIGPENAEIAEVLEPWLASHNIALISPLVGAAHDSSGSCHDPWIQLAPSASLLGEAMAVQVLETGTTEVIVVSSTETYDQAFNNAFMSHFISKGGKVRMAVSIDPVAQSFNTEITQILSSNVTSVVLTVSPRAGAIFVNEYFFVSQSVTQWFLSPRLKTDLLLQNIIPASLEGARGISPSIFDKRTTFPNAFAARWEGDSPLEGAYFYYDAMALLGIALERSTVLPIPGDLASFEALNRSIFASATTHGQIAGWNDIERALGRIRSGNTVYYEGLTGPLLLDSCGGRPGGVTQAFRVIGGKFIDD